MRYRRASVTDEVVDPVSAVAGRVQHPANDMIRVDDALLAQAGQDLLDKRPQPDEDSVFQLFNLGREVFQEALAQHRVLGHVRCPPGNRRR